jgi:hypothetical protein
MHREGQFDSCCFRNASCRVSAKHREIIHRTILLSDRKEGTSFFVFDGVSSGSSAFPSSSSELFSSSSENFLSFRSRSFGPPRAMSMEKKVSLISNQICHTCTSLISEVSRTFVPSKPLSSCLNGIISDCKSSSSIKCQNLFKSNLCVPSTINWVLRHFKVGH